MNKLPKDKSEPISFFLITILTGEYGCFRKSAQPLLPEMLLDFLSIEFVSSQVFSSVSMLLQSKVCTNPDTKKALISKFRYSKARDKT